MRACYTVAERLREMTAVDLKTLQWYSVMIRPLLTEPIMRIRYGLCRSDRFDWFYQAFSSFFRFLFFMTIAALGGSLFHLLMAPFAGFVSPVLTKSCNLATLFRLMTGGASLFQLDRLMLRVREVYIAVLGGEADHVAGQGCSGCEHDDGNAENQILHF